MYQNSRQRHTTLKKRRRDKNNRGISLQFLPQVQLKGHLYQRKREHVGCTESNKFQSLSCFHWHNLVSIAHNHATNIPKLRKIQEIQAVFKISLISSGILTAADDFLPDILEKKRSSAILTTANALHKIFSLVGISCC